jgi:hypothetical protein
VTKAETEQLRAELMLASIGLRSILEADPRWNVQKAEDADKFLPRARALILRFMSGAEAEPSKLPAFKWSEVSKLLNETGDAQIEALARALHKDDLDHVRGLATNLINVLQAQLPRSIHKTAVKATVSEPAPMELGRFARKWAVATDPMVVIRDLADGSIDPAMVTALQAMYPMIFQAISGPGGVIDDAIATMKARRGPNWDIDVRRDKVLRTLLAAPTFVPGLVTGFTASRQEGQPRKPPQRSPALRLDKLQERETLPGEAQ